MTRSTRYFLFGSITVLLVGLCTGLIAYYSGMPLGALGRGESPAELSYVPADASLVAYCDVQNVMRSEFRQRLHATLPNHEEGQAELERETGINIERDIDHVVAFMRPTNQPDHEYTGMVLASGRFDVTRLEGVAREHGGQVEEYKGRRLITVTPPENPQARSMSMAFLTPGLVGLGDTAIIKAAIDNTGGQSNVLSNKELMDQVQGLQGNDAWAVGRFDAFLNRANLPSGVVNQIPPIRWFSAAGQIDGGVAATLRAEGRDEQAGQNLRDVVNGFVALARLQTGNRPELQSLVNSVQIGGSGRSVSISVSVPVEIFNLAAAAHGTPDAMPAPPVR